MMEQGPSTTYQAVNRNGEPFRTFDDPKTAKAWLQNQCVAVGARVEKVRTTRQVLAVKS
jgi:hypothetical protein